MRAAGRTLTLDELLDEVGPIRAADLPVTLSSGRPVRAVALHGSVVELDDSRPHLDDAGEALTQFVCDLANGEIAAKDAKGRAVALLDELGMPMTTAGALFGQMLFTPWRRVRGGAA